MALITPENKAELAKRAKSFVWRLGGMIGAAVLQFTLDSLGLISLPPQVTVVLGLGLGEATKWLNNKLSQ